MDPYIKNFIVACNSLLLIVSLFVTGCDNPKPESPIFNSALLREATGLSWLSAQNGKCEFVDALKPLSRPILAFLWSSFGSDPTCIYQFLQLPQKHKRLHVYLSNGSCERSGTCSGLEVAHEREIPIRLLQVVELVRDYDVELSVAPGLEDNFDIEKAKRLGKEIKRLAPEVILVRNAVSPSVRLEAPYQAIEYHHADPVDSPCIWSNDGFDSPIDGTVWGLPYQYSVEELITQLTNSQHCERIVWLAEANCLTTDAALSPPPYERTCNYPKNLRVDFLFDYLNYM